MKKILTFIIIVLSTSATFSKKLSVDTTAGWYLAWSDEFDYEDKELDKKWKSQNGPSGHILCSRWRENAVVKDGLLYLINKKENRGGQEWTSANLTSHERFKYGYFECRYKYADAKATNNSFWLMTPLNEEEPKEGKKFEIDINEGHIPNQVNTNIHQWSDFTLNEQGKKTHYSSHKAFVYGANPGYSIQLETPINTTKIRFQSTHHSAFSMGEFRVFGLNDGNYPDVLSNTADTDIPGLINLAAGEGVTITSSDFRGNTNANMLVDGNPKTSWATQELGDKWLEFEWEQGITVGCIQFLNGWQDAAGNWRGLIDNYKVQYLNEGVWKDISVLNVTESYNFAEEFHIFGLKWDEEEIIFYFDGEEIRREKNDFCYSESPIWLSLAIVNWAGPITDAIDGTSMKVDYVRYYKQRIDIG